MGIITGDNIYYLSGANADNGYVFSFSVKGGADAFKEYVLDDTGYVGPDGRPAGGDASFKIKSRRVAREINVSVKSGGKTKKVVYEKQVVFWAKKYADKAELRKG
jgi:hypothetical protein